MPGWQHISFEAAGPELREFLFAALTGEKQPVDSRADQTVRQNHDSWNRLVQGEQTSIAA